MSKTKKIFINLAKTEMKQKQNIPKTKTKFQKFLSA